MHAHASRVAIFVLITSLAFAGLAAAETNGSAVVDRAKAQDWRQVQMLLDQGADINARHGDGTSALHWAAYWDALEAVDQLVGAGADVNARNDLGVTPLWLACNNGSTPMVRALLDAGADANAALPSGETPLMTAARTGTVASVEALLAHGADVNAAEGSHGQTALMWAVAQGHSPVVEVLIAGGANLHVRTHVYPKMISSSGNADTSGVYEIAQGGYTALLFAARGGDIASARQLLEAGANANDTAPMGTSALVVAAHSGHGQVASLLLEHGADPNAADAGYTALHAAVLRGDLSLVQALLAKGANPNPTLTRGTPARRTSADWTLGHNLIGSTPYWLAARFREPAIMQALVDGGADPLTTLNGTTASMAAITGGSTRGRFGTSPEDPAEEQRIMLESIELALDLGVDVNAVDATGNTAMHTAASRKLDAVIQLLADRGAVVDLRNARGETPLSLAMAGPRGLAALYNPSSDNASTVALLRALGATDEGAAAEADAEDWR